MSRDASLTLPAELVRAYDALLVNRHDTYAIQFPMGRYARVGRPLDALALRAHLEGRETIAVYALDRHGLGRWLCFDCDAPDGLAQLAIVQRALLDLGMPSVREASRRGGHLWVFCATPQPGMLLMGLGQGVLALLEAQGQLATPMEVYPSSESLAPGGVGHAMRAPLGVHQVTGQRYPLLDGPGASDDLGASLARLVGRPRVTAGQLRTALAQVNERLTAVLDAAALALTPAPPPSGYERGTALLAPALTTRTGEAMPASRGSRPGSGSAPSRFDVIAWVNRALALPELIAELTPGVQLTRMGRGFGGWCPWHDDAATQADGTPGTPSLYVVEDWTHGWSWRCYSTHCATYQALLHDTFDWLVCFTEGDRQRAIAWGRDRLATLQAAEPGSSSPMRLR